MALPLPVVRLLRHWLVGTKEAVYIQMIDSSLAALRPRNLSTWSQDWPGAVPAADPAWLSLAALLFR